MTYFSDTFTRTGNLSGSKTEAGNGTWLATGSVNLDGDTANLPPSTSAYLHVGAGDVDLTAQVSSGLYAGIFIRSSAGAGGWRMESYYQTVSSGSYQTVTNYFATYVVVGSSTYTGDANTCPQTGDTLGRSQCNNPNFPSYLAVQPCGTHGSFYNASLTGVRANGTCQVYVSGSYTIYYTRLLDPSGSVIWSGSTGATPSLRLRAQGSTITAWVNGGQVATATDSDPASRLQVDHGVYSGGDSARFTTITVDTLNTAPNAPIVLSPASNSVVDRTQPVTLAWSFNDPDVSDAQSKFDLQYRLVGDAAWVPVSSETPVTRYVVAAGTLADGAQYEWQVRTYDSQGVLGPWSPTSYFRAGTPPPPPTWLAPPNGGQIPTETFAARWSSASQVAYEVRVYADTAGAPDYSSALYATGTVVSNARELQLAFTTNNVVRHLQVRIQAGGLWSTWASTRASVSYTPPAVPLVSVTADDLGGRIYVDLTNPARTGTQPAVLFHDLYRQSGTAGEERVAAHLEPGQDWVDFTPASGVEHLYRAVSFGSNGVTSTSAPTA